MTSTAKHLIEELLSTEGSPLAEAERLYDRAQSEHAEWWAAYRQGEVDAADFADKLMDRFYQAYGLEPGSHLADLVHEHIYAGLT